MPSRPTLICFAGMLAFALHLSFTRALADEGPPVPAPMELINLVRDTVLAVDTGNKSSDYSVLSAMGGTDFKAAYPPEKLAGLFAPLRAEHMDLAAVRDKVPLTTRPPTLDRNGRLRILGFFEFPGTQLVYDVLYDYDAPGKRWLLAAILLQPRTLEPQPELLQPQ